MRPGFQHIFGDYDWYILQVLYRIKGPLKNPAGQALYESPVLGGHSTLASVDSLIRPDNRLVHKSSATSRHTFSSFQFYNASN